MTDNFTNITTISPPVVETVMGIQFSPLNKMRIQDYGSVCEHFKGDFDSIEEHERLPAVSETKENPGALQGWKLVSGVQMPRVWLIGAKGTHGQYILQFQDDRFLMNWRTVKKDGRDYPSHKENIKIFEGFLQRFLALVSDQQLGRFEPEQCEITYVNHIQVLGQKSPITAAAEAFTFLTAPQALTGVGENFVFNSSSWSNELRGRVYTSLQSAVHKETREPLLDFRLTARGAPTVKNQDGVIKWLDEGHRIIVGSFTSLTSPEMHKAWGVK